MILHHYDVSPYSEKIRLMFGYADLAWQSCVSPPLPPRPIVDPLVGGYRRIPVAQIGADLFCDTRIIAAEIARLCDKPSLSFEHCSTAARDYAVETNRDIFMPVVQTAVTKSVFAMLITRYWPWQIARLAKDRAGVAKSSTLPRRKRAELEKMVADFRKDLEQRLSQADFLFGDEPCIADFAAYHLVWFADKTRPGRFLKDLQHASQWQTRMKAFGHGASVKINKKFVFQSAKESQPRGLSNDQMTHADIGETVTIKPTDYARDSVTGQLVGADAHRWILARHTEDFGTLHVHFPTVGYELKVISR